MIRLILVRHGNTFEAGEVPIQVGARTDLALTAMGRKQAEAIGAFLAGEALVPKVIYAGGLKRQRDSAEIIGKRLNREWVLEPALTEIDYGAWEGLTAEEIAKKWPNEYLGWMDGKWPAHIFAENEASYRTRVEQWVESLKGEGETPVVAVTSGGILRLFQNEKVKTGHFCEVQLLEKGWNVVKWNRPP